MSAEDLGKDLSVFEPIQRAEKLMSEAYGISFVTLEESVRGDALELLNQGIRD